MKNNLEIQNKNCYIDSYKKLWLYILFCCKVIDMRRKVVLIENDKNDDVLERHGAANNDEILCFTLEKSWINAKNVGGIKKYVTNELCTCVQIVKAVFEWQRHSIGRE